MQYEPNDNRPVSEKIHPCTTHRFTPIFPNCSRHLSHRPIVPLARDPSSPLTEGDKQFPFDRGGNPGVCFYKGKESEGGRSTNRTLRLDFAPGATPKADRNIPPWRRRPFGIHRSAPGAPQARGHSRPSPSFSQVAAQRFCCRR